MLETYKEIDFSFWDTIQRVAEKFSFSLQKSEKYTRERYDLPKLLSVPHGACYICPRAPRNLENFFAHGYKLENIGSNVDYADMKPIVRG